MSSELREERVHLGPHQFWTGRFRYAADGLIVTIRWAETVGAEPRPENVIIEQVHDINSARHRHVREIRTHLLACVRILLEEGLAFMQGDELYLVPSGRIQTAPKMSVHGFHTEELRYGPFSARAPKSDG